mmetsp:Transcript_134210/g.189639  ORF Transcript_134210/g.189639 Transcript_134210/m.189639 type:complete len:109 (+) Transcript_134210:1702-2028(+)
MYKILSDSDFFEYVLNLVQRYEWHNILHSQVEKIIVHTIQNNDSKELLDALFLKAKIIQFVINRSNEGDAAPGNCKNKQRKGNIGFLTKVANLFEKNNTKLEIYMNDY